MYVINPNDFTRYGIIKKFVLSFYSNKKKKKKLTGFIAGQLIIFTLIYYVLLHLALGRLDSITVLVLL
ncbi:hypothetical protein BT93_B2633 [Corymbia citriodora subsp. variegata]|nr:hypothetical protein BT93_B2633 [Corymbia citriodora subsp. variegata]